MLKNNLDNIPWHTDKNAAQRDEPGIVHSYAASLATALDFLDEGIQP